MEIFEYAVANKLRFNYKGSLSVEDLYDLKLTDLNEIYKKLKREARDLTGDSLLDKPTKELNEINIKLELVEIIAGRKQEEQNARIRQAANKEMKETINSLIKEKENEKLKSLSIEQLKDLAKSL